MISLRRTALFAAAPAAIAALYLLAPEPQPPSPAQEATVQVLMPVVFETPPPTVVEEVPDRVEEVFVRRGEVEVAIADRDKDGVDEQMTRTYDGGSGFGGSTCRLTDPSIELDVEVSYFGSFGSFVDAAIAPETANPAFIDALRHCLFNADESTDPSFDRWLDLMRAYDDAIIWHLPRRRLEAPLRWLPGEPQLPRSAFRVFAPQEAESWMRRVFFDGPPAELGYRSLWMRYGAHAHTSSLRGSNEFRELARRGTERLLATEHGVVWARDGQYAWAFVSDVKWGGPEKLRHRSIESAGFDEDGIWVRVTDNNGATLWHIDQTGLRH